MCLWWSTHVMPKLLNQFLNSFKTRGLEILLTLDEMLHYHIQSAQQLISDLVDFRLGLLICQRVCQGRGKEIWRGSILPRTAGTAAGGGAKTAWYTLTLGPPLLLFLTPWAPTGNTGTCPPQWGAYSHLTTPHLRDLYHAWPICRRQSPYSK